MKTYTIWASLRRLSGLYLHTYCVYAYVYSMFLNTYMVYMCIYLKKKEDINLQSSDGYMGEFVGRKGRGSGTIIISKDKTTIKKLEHPKIFSCLSSSPRSFNWIDMGCNLDIKNFLSNMSVSNMSCSAEPRSRASLHGPWTKGIGINWELTPCAEWWPPQRDPRRKPQFNKLHSVS